MRGVWTGVTLELRALPRALHIALAALTVVWLLVARLQEPAFARNLGLPLSRAAAGAILWVGLVLMPLVFATNTGPDAEGLVPRAHQRRLREIAVISISTMCYGVLFAGFTLATCAVVDFITLGRMLTILPLQALLAALLVLAPLATLGPGLAALRWRTPYLLLAWLVVAVLQLGRPESELLVRAVSGTSTALDPRMLISSALWTGAGFALSAGLLVSKPRT
ncbi:MAG: hypothetical protein IT458_09880 [Planctomycetes bacterium]|nr:hypothetical protein [Planctomycetota bacterium]